MVTLTPEQETTLLIGLGKPLAIEPERYERWLEIIQPTASEYIQKAIDAVRDRFSKAFPTAAPSEEEKERRLREIVADMLAADDDPIKEAGAALRGHVNRLYRKRQRA